MDWKYLRGRISNLRNVDDATRTQWASIWEAAFEYFISITMSGAFFTLLVKQMGVSDALTGILSSISVLACGVQMFATSILRNRRSIRKSVLVLQTMQQLLYSFLYLLPFVPIPGIIKVGVFAGVYLAATLLTNLIAPAKINWFLHFVKPGNRGIFTAHKEMVSLITGLIYNYVMSLAVDHFDSQGRPEIGLILCSVVIFLVMLCHVGTLLAAKDAPEILEESRKTGSLKESFRTNFSNPAFVKLFIMCCGWVFFYWICTPYYSVFMLQEVGSSVTYIAVTGIVSSLVRFFISPSMGKYCDKYGYTTGVRLGFWIAGAAFGLLTFWRPSNGNVFFMIYQILMSVAMSALSNGMSIILLQYIPEKDKVGGLGIYSALSGMLGFVGSLLGGWILERIQLGGNQILGMNLYGQQFLSFVAFVGIAGLVIYNKTVIQKMKRLE